jgi:hypothetical protein
MLPFRSKRPLTVMGIMCLLVFQVLCLTFVLHRCSLEGLTLPSHLSMPHITHTPTGQRHKRLWFPFLITPVRPFRVRAVPRHSKCDAGKLVSTSRSVLLYYINCSCELYSMVCSMSTRDHQGPHLPSSIIPPNQHYTMPAIHHYSHPMLPSTYLQ